MVVPVAAAAVPLGAKILGAAGSLLAKAKLIAPAVKGFTGVGGAVKGGASTLGAFGKGQAARQATKRFATDALAKVSAHTPKSVKDAGNLVFGKELMDSPGDLAFRLAPDAAFGLMGAAMTPGDLGDKVIAGGSQFIGGGLTGIAASRGAKALGASQRVADMVDMGGSVVGDMAGMAVGDGIMRIKGGGETPWERQAAEQDEIYRAQILQELKQQYGLV